MSGVNSIILILLVTVILFLILLYTKIARMVEVVQDFERQITIQLENRSKVFHFLISAVKKHIDYEKTPLKEVLVLCTHIKEAKSQGQQEKRMTAENSISRLAWSIGSIFEEYPQLKEDKEAVRLGEEIFLIEGKLEETKRDYNLVVEQYNRVKANFPESLVASLFKSSLDKNFLYWNLEESTVETEEEVL